MDQDITLPKEIEVKIRKKLITKFTVILLLSNLSVYILGNKSEQKEIVPLEKVNLILTIKTKVKLQEEKTPVSLYNSKMKFISNDIFIIKEIEQDQLLHSQKDLLSYEVEVPKKDYPLILNSIDESFIAYPKGYKAIPKRKLKRGPYEINF